jgi:hypothetical protein
VTGGAEALRENAPKLFKGISHKTRAFSFHCSSVTDKPQKPGELSKLHWEVQKMDRDHLESQQSQGKITYSRNCIAIDTAPSCGMAGTTSKCQAVNLLSCSVQHRSVKIHLKCWALYIKWFGESLLTRASPCRDSQYV